MIDGNKGSFVGASVDGMTLSFGGIPGKSSVLSKPTNFYELNTSTGIETAQLNNPHLIP